MDAAGFLEYITASTIAGNWLYLENILIGNSSVIQNESPSRNFNIDNLTISPNPTTVDDGNISFELIENTDIVISLTNFLGRRLGEKQLKLDAGSYEYKLGDLFQLSHKGTYILSVEGTDSRLSEIIIIH